MATEDNGNIGVLKPTTSSTEDLSEYTDADESISAPTEFLAEFLSAVMLKDYETALKYCKLILQYEPNNVTAKEFYPLIIDKLQHEKVATGGDNDTESDDEDCDNSSSSSSDSESSSSSSSSDSSEDQEEEEQEDGDVECLGNKHHSSSDGDATTGSYSSLEDDEAEADQLSALAARYHVDNINFGNGNKLYGTSKTPNIATKLWDNMSPSNMDKVGSETHHQLPFGTSSDSESPTEPVSQQTVAAAAVRSKIVPIKP